MMASRLFAGLLGRSAERVACLVLPAAMSACGRSS
jgi:hypothetical protein